MILNIARAPIVQRLGAAVVDQVLLSGANFVVGLLLIRYASNHDYGYFVLAQSMILLCVSAQGSFVGAPLSVLAPKQTDERRRAMVGRVRTDQARWLRWLPVVGCVAAPALVLAGVIDLYEGAVVGAASLAAWATLRREYVKSVLLIYQRPAAILSSDVVYVVMLVLLVVVAVVVHLVPAAIAIAGLGVAAAVADRYSNRSVALDPGWDTGMDDAQGQVMWREMRSMAVWATVGAVIYWVFSQGYNTMLGLKLDAAAVAAANAARLLLMPTFLLTTGVRGMLIPMASRWLHERGLAVVLKRVTLVALVLCVLGAIYLVFLYFGRDWVSENVLRKVIPDRDRLLVLWALLSLLNLVREMFQAALLALQRFQMMAWLTGASAVLSLSVMWVGIDRAGVAGALVGLLAGELLSLLGVLAQLAWAYYRGAGKPSPRNDGPPSDPMAIDMELPPGS